MESKSLTFLRNDEYKIELERKLFRHWQNWKKSLDDVITVAKVKQLNRGRFDKKIFLDKVLESND